MSEKSTFDFTNFKVDFTNFKVDFTNFKVDFTNFKVDFTNFKNLILPTLKLAKRKKITKWHQEASVLFCPANVLFQSDTISQVNLRYKRNHMPTEASWCHFVIFFFSFCQL